MYFKNVFKVIAFVSILLVGGNAYAGTFGYAGGSKGSPFEIQDQITGSLYTLSEVADIQSVSAWIDFGQGTSKVKVGIYDVAGDLVAESIEYLNEAGNIDPAWFVFTFENPPLLQAGDYWLIVIGDTEYVYAYLESGTGWETYQATSSYNGLPSTFSGIWAKVNNVVILATYREPYVSIPSDIASTTLAYAGALFTDLAIPIILTIGLPMAFWVIKKIIALV